MSLAIPSLWLGLARNTDYTPPATTDLHEDDGTTVLYEDDGTTALTED